MDSISKYFGLTVIAIAVASGCSTTSESSSSSVQDDSAYAVPATAGSSSGSAATASSTSAAGAGGTSTTAKAASGKNRLSQITVGMTNSEVSDLAGIPDDRAAYMTGKAWVPFFFGSDTSRENWFYTGQGHIVFSRNRYSGGLTVIEVVADVNRDANGK
jgi:hypothetical protein